jgi:hypothetical protein
MFVVRQNSIRCVNRRGQQVTENAIGRQTRRSGEVHGQDSTWRSEVDGDAEIVNDLNWDDVMATDRTNQVVATG